MSAVTRSFGRSLLRVAILLFVVVAMVIPSQANATPDGQMLPVDGEDQLDAQSVQSEDPSLVPQEIVSPDAQDSRATRTLSVTVKLPAGTNPQWLANAYASLIPVHSYPGAPHPSKKINPSTGHVTMTGIPSGQYRLAIDFRKDITLDGNWFSTSSALIYYPGTMFYWQEAQIIDLEPHPETTVAVNVPQDAINTYYSYPNGVPSADGTGRWIQSVHDWIFTDNNWNAYTGWHFVDGYWYWTTGDASLARGWHLIWSKWYFFQEGTTRMHIGWHQEYDGTWYYLGSNGAMVTGWAWIGGNWYYFHGNGAMATGWAWIGGSWYYFHSGGAMATGWVWIGGSWYYFHSGGAMATGWVKIGGTWYYFSPSGAWLY